MTAEKHQPPPPPTDAVAVVSDETASRTEQLQDELDGLNARITRQGAEVRQLKKDGGGGAGGDSSDALGDAVRRLQELKLQASRVSERLDAASDRDGDDKKNKFNRKSFDDLVLRKMFVVNAFEIHGGVKGLFDLGPPATALKVRAYTGVSSLVFFFLLPSLQLRAHL